jgi:cellobiose phosphorylase
MGFRDSNQDLIGFVQQYPTPRERIIDIASTSSRTAVVTPNTN